MCQCPIHQNGIKLKLLKLNLKRNWLFIGWMELSWSVTEWTVIENDMLGHHQRLRGLLGHGVGK